MNQRFIEFIQNNKLLVLLFMAIIFLRLWQISHYFIFDIDVQYQAPLAWEQIKNFHIIWIGVSASNIGYYLGPGLVYLTAFLLKLSNGDPIILGYFSSIVGIITAGSLYYVGRQLFNEKVALIALTLYGFSHFMIQYDRRFWPIFIPLIAIWIYYSLVRAKKNGWWLVISVFLISAAYHIHLSLLIFWPFILLAVYENRHKLSLKLISLCISLYLIITSPLLVFDVLHNFDNLLLPVKIIQSQTGENSINILNSFDYLKDVVAQIVIFDPASESTPLFLFAGVVFLLFIQSRKWHTITREHQYLLGILAVMFMAVLLYPGPLQQYYGVLFAPFVILIVSTGLTKLKPKYMILSLILYSTLNLYSFFTQDTSNGLTVKKKFIQTVSEKIGERPYRLEFEGEKDYHGWRYLFQKYAGTPVSSTTDRQFGWIYQSEISTDHEITVFVGDNPPSNADIKIAEGPYNAYITIE